MVKFYSSLEVVALRLCMTEPVMCDGRIHVPSGNQTRLAARNPELNGGL